MEDMVGVLVFLVVGGIVAAVIGIGIYFQQQQQARLAAAYKQICQLYNGRFTEPGWFQTGMAQFPYRGGMVTLDVFTTGGKNKRSYTRIWMPWPDYNLYLNIAPQGFFGMLGEMVGMTDVKVGDQGFDDRYYISTNAPDLVPRLANAAARNHVNALYDLMGNYEIDWTVEGGGMRVMKFGIIDDPQMLLHFVQASIALHEAALGLSPEGAKSAAAPPALPAAGQSIAPQVIEVAQADCPVCGEKTARDAVICIRCQSPHHRECWRYNGKCSTYGCGELQYREVG